MQKPYRRKRKASTGLKKVHVVKTEKIKKQTGDKPEGSDLVFLVRQAGTWDLGPGTLC